MQPVELGRLTLLLFPSVRSLHPADGAPAVHALLRHRAGVCPLLPPAARGPVQQANGADAGAR